MSQEITTKEPSQFAAVRTLLNEQRGEIARALPKHFNVDRMLRIALTEVRKNPELLDCQKESFLGAIIQSSQLGLEPGNALGQCYLIPFKNSKRGIKEVQLMIGYQGFIDLISRTDNAPVGVPCAVYEGDEFEYALGLAPTIAHRPAKARDPKAKLTHAYVVYTFHDGRKVFDVMNRQEIDAVRARSKSTGFSPWQSDFEAMAKKSVIRRIFKYLPKSVELQRAVNLDEQAEIGESQKNETFVPSSVDPQSKRERVESAINNKVQNDSELFDNFEG